ncbi:hypothetical protein IFR05_015105 [Cadophora sp. M221]|nr:hypothetical protein IFR05_015105 [Cadophora sp. M221]
MTPKSIKTSEARKSQNRIAQRKFRERKAAEFNKMHERLKATDKELLRLKEIIFQVLAKTTDSTITILCQEASTQAIGFEETPEHDSYASGTWPNSVLSDTNGEESTIVSAPKDSNPTIETPGTFSRDNSLAIQPFTTNWLNPFVNNYSNGNDLNDYFNHLAPDFNDQLVCYQPEASYAAYTDLFASSSYDMPWNNATGY